MSVIFSAPNYTTLCITWTRKRSPRNSWLSANPSGLRRFSSWHMALQGHQAQTRSDAMLWPGLAIRDDDDDDDNCITCVARYKVFLG